MAVGDQTPKTPEDQIRQDNNDYKPILFDDFVRFLESVTADNPCQACGGAQFAPVAEPTNFEVAAFITTPIRGIGDGRKAIPALAVICKRCGWIRTHASLAVRRWLANNPPTQSEASLEDAAE